jgi:carbon-monoxide dehydrogenase large subunit
MAGVAGVFSAADLTCRRCRPERRRPPWPAPSWPPRRSASWRGGGGGGRRDRAQALDAAEAVEVDYEPLPVVTDPEAALAADAPRLFADGGNLARERRWPDPTRALEGAEVLVRARFVNQRVAPSPLEPNAAVAVPTGGGLLLYVPCQAPFWVRDTVAEVLGMDPERVRVVVPAVGGAFGARIATYPEQVAVAALARRLGRPVRYVESRSETMLAMTHGRAQVQEVELAATRDGRITGLRARLVADGGAYPGEATSMPSSTRYMASGVYRIPRVEVAWSVVATNTTPVAAYRGAGRPEATSMVERAVDLLAARLRLDPAEVRRRNLIPARAFPYTTATRARYDSGDYGRALDLVLEAAGYDDLRADQARRRERGDVRQLGIGLSVYVEVTGFGSSTARSRSSPGAGSRPGPGSHPTARATRRPSPSWSPAPSGSRPTR